MKVARPYRAIGAAVALAILAAGPVLATDGYFSNGFGTRAKGMAGAGVALPQDAMSAVVNPAGLVRVGNRFDIGANLFNPERQYSVNGAPSGAPGTFGLAPDIQDSRNQLFLIPHLAYSRSLGHGRAFGIALYGNGGMNTTWPADASGGHGLFGAGEAGVNLAQLFISPTYSANIGSRTSVGVSPVLAYQQFEARGLNAFGGFVADGNPDNLTNRGSDSSTGYGARVGVLHSLGPKLDVGLTYQTKIKMGRFKKYSDLFASQGTFNIPPKLAGGIAYKATSTSVLALDVQTIYYSAIPSVSNPFSNLFTGFGGDPNSLLGGNNGPGFGWRDVTTYKLGYQWQAGPGWALRTGVSYGRQPIPSSEVLFNLLAPGVQEWHITGGFTRDMGKSGELSVAAVYSPRRTVRGPNPLEAPGQQTIDLSMRQLELEIGWGRKF